MRRLQIVALSFVIVAALAWTLMSVVLPIAVDRGIRGRLDRAGFAHASFTLGSVTLDRVELLDVSLQRGLALGDVVIEAGPYQLWRGDLADVVVRGAEIDARTSVATSGTGARLPFARVFIEDSSIVDDTQRIAVRGSIDLRGREPALDLVAHTAALRVGTLLIEDAAATVRGPLAALRACATGRITEMTVDGCLVIDAGERTASLEWAAHDSRVAATGGGTLRLAGDTVLLDGGTIDATLAATSAGGVSLDPVALHGVITADLSQQTFTVAGELRSDRIAARGVTLRNVALPIAIDGTVRDGLSLHSKTAWLVAADTATVTAMGRSLTLEHPVLRAIGRSVFGPVQLEAGDDRPLEIASTLRGVPLDQILAAATRERVRATGVVDGVVVFTVDDTGLSLADATLTTREGGTLRIPDLGAITPARFGVHERVAAALSDFAYSKLTLDVDDPSTLRLSLAGRGKRITQELAVDINVRGLLAQRNQP